MMLQGGGGIIKPGDTLLFDVELLDFYEKAKERWEMSAAELMEEATKTKVVFSRYLTKRRQVYFSSSMCSCFGFLVMYRTQATELPNCQLIRGRLTTHHKHHVARVSSQTSYVACVLCSLLTSNYKIFHAFGEPDGEPSRKCEILPTYYGTCSRSPRSR